MKLAEALILRADYQKRLEQLKQRITRNALIQEGDSASEDPRILLDQHDALAADLMRMIQQINATNSRSNVANFGTLSDAVARRDVLRLRHLVYRDLAAQATATYSRATRSEVRFIPAVDVAAIQRQADALAQEHRELDARIQEANWQIDLIEDRQ